MNYLRCLFFPVVLTRVHHLVLHRDHPERHLQVQQLREVQARVQVQTQTRGPMKQGERGGRGRRRLPPGLAQQDLHSLQEGLLPHPRHQQCEQGQGRTQSPRQSQSWRWALQGSPKQGQRQGQGQGQGQERRREQEQGRGEVQQHARAPLQAQAQVRMPLLHEDQAQQHPLRIQGEGLR
jgi:hypothetical protein